MAVRRPCPTPRCPELQPCDDHPRVPFANAKRSTTLYSTARWRRESKAFLLANPNCVALIPAMAEREFCGKFANIVDHRIPHRGDEVAFWDHGNWAPMCRAHHNAKTGRETRERVAGRA